MSYKKALSIYNYHQWTILRLCALLDIPLDRFGHILFPMVSRRIGREVRHMNDMTIGELHHFVKHLQTGYGHDIFCNSAPAHLRNWKPGPEELAAVNKPKRRRKHDRQLSA